jgi:precorrin-4/cobalt-precorrin-4 C11-methyltransferase
MKIYFIGAGPGDTELLTIKGKKIIDSADIIIYAGSLVNKDILKTVMKDAQIYDSSGMTLEEVLNIFSKAKSTGKIIARVHSGDPSIYGAIGEQLQWCEKENVEYKVIPGVSSFSAAAASLGQELTLPDVSQTVILTRMQGKTKVPGKESLEKLSKITATMVIFLSVQDIEKVVEKLKQGYKPDTPVAVIEKASYPDEKKIFGTLLNIAEKVKKENITRQAIIIVGDVLKKDFTRSRLYASNFHHGFRNNTKKHK